MDTDVPRMPSVKNLHAILDAVQNAAEPDAFGLDFLKDMGFTSSNDRSVIKVLKFLGMLDASGKPQTHYREFMNHTRARAVLAERMAVAYDDLFKSDKNAHAKSASSLTGWFKTKTGVGTKVAEKMATTFKSLASYADFSEVQTPAQLPKELPTPPATTAPENKLLPANNLGAALGLTYRIEIHLPDTTNVDTFRAIFRAIREELA